MIIHLYIYIYIYNVNTEKNNIWYKQIKYIDYICIYIYKLK